jgi:hypothetical protein
VIYTLSTHCAGVLRRASWLVHGGEQHVTTWQRLRTNVSPVRRRAGGEGVTKLWSGSGSSSGIDRVLGELPMLTGLPRQWAVLGELVSATEVPDGRTDLRTQARSSTPTSTPICLRCATTQSRIGSTGSSRLGRSSSIRRFPTRDNPGLCKYLARVVRNFTSSKASSRATFTEERVLETPA